MAHGAPPIEQRRLRAELRRFRDESGRTQKVVAEALGWSSSKLIRIETGAANVTVSDLRALLHYYDIGPEPAKALLAIASGKGHQDAWWDQHRGVLAQQLVTYLGYEDAARVVRQFMVGLVPGILQTEAYTRALFTAFHNVGESAERGVVVRKRRQELLNRDDGRSWQFILDESVILRRVGGPEVMAAQLSRLKDLAEQPHISIRILPFIAGAHPAMMGSFSVLEFSVEYHDHVVVLDDPNRELLIRDESETSSAHLKLFAELQEIATAEGDLSKIVDPLIDDLRATERGNG